MSSKGAIYVIICLLLLNHVNGNEWAVKWGSQLNVSIDNTYNKVTSTAAYGWNNSGVRSKNTLKANANGHIWFKDADIYTTKAIGLTTNNGMLDVNKIDYAFVLSQGWIYIYQSGYYRGQFGGYNPNDMLSIEREGNIIYFKRNGWILYWIFANPSQELSVEASFFNNNAYLKQINSSFGWSFTLYVNSENLPQGIDYEVSVNENTVRCSTNTSCENTYSEDALNGLFKIRVNQTEASNSLELISTLNFDEFTSIFMLVPNEIDSTELDTIELGSNWYEVLGGNHLFLYDGTNSQAEIELLYGLDLQNGLGFSPNGDQLYDQLKLFGAENISQFQISVSEPNGNVVFQSIDKNFSWDGNYLDTQNIVPRGTYLYELTIDEIVYQGTLLVDY